MMSQCQSSIGHPYNQNGHEDSDTGSMKKGTRLRSSQKLIYNISGVAKSATINSTSYLFSAVTRGIKGTKNSIMGLVGGYSPNSASEPAISVQSFRPLNLDTSTDSNYSISDVMDKPPNFEEDESSKMKILTDNIETCSQDFYSGYLQKWTNYYGGYRKRFFSVDPIRNTLSYYKGEYDWPDKPRATVPLSRLKVLLPLSPTEMHRSASMSPTTFERNAPLKFDILVIKPKGSNKHHHNLEPESQIAEKTFEPKFYIWHLKADTNEQSFQWISLLARISSRSSCPSSLNPSPFPRSMNYPLLVPNPALGQRPTSVILSKDWDGIFHDLISICNTETITKFTFQNIRDLLFLLKSCREEEIRLHGDQIACLKEKLRWLAFQAIPSQTIPSVIDLQTDEMDAIYRGRDITGDGEENDTSSLALTEASSNVESIDSDASSSGDDLFFECENYRTSPQIEVGVEDLSPCIPKIGISELPSSSTVEAVLFPDSLSSSAIGYPPVPRARLPKTAAIDLSTVSVWSILRQAIGKDLTRLCVPIQFNEPLSMLQRVAEDMEYWSLIEQSIAEPLPERRLLFISAFALSVYSTTSDGRLGKPFNPLLHETYELVYRDQKSTPPRVAFRYISEQVSHHPPISASIAEGHGWVFESETRVKMSFWGKYISLIPSCWF